MLDLFKKYRYYLLLHLIVVIFGFTAILKKEIDMEATHVVFYRMGLAFIGLIIFLKLARWDFKALFKSKVKFLATGLITAAHWVFFFESIDVSNVSICLATMSSTSLFVALLEPWLFKRKVRLIELFFGGLIIVGLVLIFSFEHEYLLGIVYGLISAFLAALFGTLNGLYMREKHKAHTITLYEMIGGVIGITVYLAISGAFNASFFQIKSTDWIFLLILAFVCTSFAYVASVYVMKSLSPFTVALTINLEPVYGILLALIIYKQSEFMSQGFYWGCVVIIGTILANAWYKKHLRGKMSPSAEATKD